MPANIIFVGAPGTAKTDLSLKIGSEADAPAFEMHSPKGSLVGETERKMRLTKLILSSFSPHIIFIDEITEMLPLQRSDFDGDSGASKSVTAGLLSILSDESRRGNSLLIGTTNCPWRIGAAMQSRFVFIPVLHPLEMDFPSIVVETSVRVANVNFDINEPLIQKAAKIDLLVLDLCIPKEINSQTGGITGTYNGLHLIAFADNQGKKPKSAISLTTATGEGIPDEVNSDMGRDYLEGYFHKDNFLCLHKGRDDNSAIQRLSSRLLNICTDGTQSLPRILKLLLPHKPFTVSFLGMDSSGEPIINLYSSHTSTSYRINEDKCLQLLYLGYQNPDSIISSEDFAECLGIQMRSNSTYAQRIKQELYKITGFNESYITTYLFSTVHGRGFRLLAIYKDESSHA